MATKQFTIGDRTFNAAMASAAGQDQIISLLAQGIAVKVATALQNGESADEELMTGYVMGIEYATKQKIAGILLAKVFIEGAASPVDVKDFEGRMVEYNRLLGNLLYWNLQDFFMWLISDLERVIKPVEAEAQ